MATTGHHWSGAPLAAIGFKCSVEEDFALGHQFSSFGPGPLLFYFVRKAELGNGDFVCVERGLVELATDPKAGIVSAGWNLANQIAVLSFLPALLLCWFTLAFSVLHATSIESRFYSLTISTSAVENKV